MIRKLLILILVAFIVTACAKETKSPLRFVKEYEALNESKTQSGKTYSSLKLKNAERIKYANYDEIDKALEKDAIIYFGFPECPWCRTLVPVLLESAKEAGIKEILYMNILNERNSYELDENGKAALKSNGTKGYNALVEKLANHLDDYTLTSEDGQKIETGTKRIFAPTLIFVSKGKVIYVHKGTVDSQEDPYLELTKEQKEELMKVLIDNMNKVLDITCEEETKC